MGFISTADCAIGRCGWRLVFGSSRCLGSAYSIIGGHPAAGRCYRDSFRNSDRRAGDCQPSGGSSEALPLLFITVTPFVPSDALCRPDDRFVLSQPLTLKAHEHAYTMGMRHRKSDEWTCPTDTVVCFIGNSAAAKAWPVTNRKLATLKAAWAPDSRAQASAATASAAAGNSYRLAPRSLASLS